MSPQSNNAKINFEMELNENGGNSLVQQDETGNASIDGTKNQTIKEDRTDNGV